MKTKTKALLSLAGAVILILVTVYATVAFLTSTTGTVTNTFTVGNVKITLDEVGVDEYGNVTMNANQETARVAENVYKLIPGHEYTKDPTIHVDENSENCYLFVRVTNAIGAIEADTKIAAQMQTKGWTLVTGTTDVYYHSGVAKGGDDVVVFEKFTITDDADLTDYADTEIEITGYAVQADGFDNAEAAWNASFGAAVTTTADTTAGA